MKNLLLVLLLCPLLSFAQTPDYLVFEIATIKVSPEKASQVETAMGIHNKKYHASGPYGARVYNVVSGPNSGDYKWVMGPLTWTALDGRPGDDMHELDWGAGVSSHVLPGGNTEYIRFDSKLSRFPSDFNVHRLLVRYVDVARGKMDKVKELLGKIQKVYAGKIPGETYGIYYNELTSTSSGRDIVIVSFFDKYSWMSADDGFDAKYEEMNGKGSAEVLWNEWRDATIAQETEIWEHNAELSGLTAAVKAAERQ